MLVDIIRNTRRPSPTNPLLIPLFTIRSEAKYGKKVINMNKNATDSESVEIA